MDAISSTELLTARHPMPSCNTPSLSSLSKPLQVLLLSTTSSAPVLSGPACESHVLDEGGRVLDEWEREATEMAEHICGNAR